MTTDTDYTLEQFLADTRATIKTKGVPSGLAEIRDHLEKLLHNPELLKKHLGDPVPYTRAHHDRPRPGDRRARARARPREGQQRRRSTTTARAGWSTATTRTPRACAAGAASTTARKPGHAELELQKEFLNEPGHAAVFAVGDIHSIEFGDDTFFIRVTGGDVETKETLKFDVEKKTVEVANRAQGPA